jgi:F-type H+-transporting ATPase subunit a
MLIIIGLALLGRRRLEKYPGRVQSLTEMIIESFDGMIQETMGSVGRRYFPLIVTMFFFVSFSNWISVIPSMKSPTSDLNTTLGLGILTFLVAQGSGVVAKGPLNYIKGFFEPYLIAPLALFINIAGEAGKTISHSFRLFGNVLGGGIIIVVISGLLGPLSFPLGAAMSAFFGLFIGLIQAFVFTILALMYITVARGE